MILRSLSLLTLLAGPLAAGEISVPADFPTIQQAVDAAAPNDTITVHQGVYLESVTISTPNLTLLGQDAVVDTAFLDDGFRVLADGATIRGFRIANTQHGIRVGGHLDESEGGGLLAPPPVVDVWLDGNTILSCKRFGILAEDTVISITDNVVRGCDQDGIAVDTFDEDPANGFEPVFTGASAVVTGNTVTRANLNGVDLKTLLATVEHNLGTQCGQNGIAVTLLGSNPGLTRVHHNRGLGNYSRGLNIDAGRGEIELVGNLAIANEQEGFEVQGEQGLGRVTLRRNRAEENYNEGIRLVNASFEAQGNRVARNGREGLYVFAGLGSTSLISHNVLRENAREGLKLQTEFAVTGALLITDNRVTGNLWDGIKVQKFSVSAELRANVVRDNGHQGISNDGVSTVIVDNLCSGNGFGVGPDIAGAGEGTGAVSVFAGNTGSGGPDTLDRL